MDYHIFTFVVAAAVVFVFVLLGIQRREVISLRYDLLALEARHEAPQKPGKVYWTKQQDPTTWDIQGEPHIHGEESKTKGAGVARCTCSFCGNVHEYRGNRMSGRAFDPAQESGRLREWNPMLI